MAITLQLLWGHMQRPWGYEIRADYTDGVKIYNEVLNFPSQPTQQQTDDAVAATQARLTAMTADPPAPEPQYAITCEDGTVVRI